MRVSRRVDMEERVRAEVLDQSHFMVEEEVSEDVRGGEPHHVLLDRNARGRGPVAEDVAITAQLRGNKSEVHIENVTHERSHALKFRRDELRGVVEV